VMKDKSGCCYGALSFCSLVCVFLPVEEGRRPTGVLRHEQFRVGWPNCAATVLCERLRASSLVAAVSVDRRPRSPAVHIPEVRSTGACTPTCTSLAGYTGVCTTRYTGAGFWVVPSRREGQAVSESDSSCVIVRGGWCDVSTRRCTVALPYTVPITPTVYAQLVGGSRLRLALTACGSPRTRGRSCVW
jgi:hypothetical protein